MTQEKSKKQSNIRENTDKSVHNTNSSNASTFTQNDGLVVSGLKTLYKNKIRPIEKSAYFNKFNHTEILDSELQAKPTVLLVGQYSTGKTSFIKRLLGCDYPGIHIGPEPTTDKFVAVVYGEETKTIMGNAATGIEDLPFSGLSCFGTSFLSKFSVAVVAAKILKSMTIIDTPGVLSGEKQRLSRGYDFSKVSRWFAERSDLILLMFDCSKLDISDEFKSVIEELQPHEDKVHCILNKADQLDAESLMRVYGALLWSMGRIFKGAEVTRVYVGSFCDEIVIKEEHKKLFDKDRDILMDQLDKLPSCCSMRKINEMVKRVRSLIVQVCILGYLRSKMPYLYGKEALQIKLGNNLKSIFEEVRIMYQLAEGDFPKVEEFRAALMVCDFSTFPTTDRKVLTQLQEVLNDDIPKITKFAAEVEEGIGKTVSDGDDESMLNLKKAPSLFRMTDGKKKSSFWIYVLVYVILILVFVAAMLGYIHMNPTDELSVKVLQFFADMKIKLAASQEL